MSEPVTAFRSDRSGEDAPKAHGAEEAERSGEGSAPNGSGSRNLGDAGGSKGANGSSHCQAPGAGDSATRAGGAQCQGSNQPQVRLLCRLECLAGRNTYFGV